MDEHDGKCDNPICANPAETDIVYAIKAEPKQPLRCAVVCRFCAAYYASVPTVRMVPQEATV